MEVAEVVAIISLTSTLLVGFGAMAFYLGRLEQRMRVVEKVLFNDLGKLHGVVHPKYHSDS